MKELKTQGSEPAFLARTPTRQHYIAPFLLPTLNEFGDELRRVLQVRVERHRRIETCGLSPHQARKQRGLKSEVARKPDKPKTPVSRTLRYDLLPAIIPAPVVHQYRRPIVPLPLAIKQPTQPLQQLRQHFALIVNRYDQRYFRNIHRSDF